MSKQSILLAIAYAWEKAVVKRKKRDAKKRQVIGTVAMKELHKKRTFRFKEDAESIIYKNRFHTLVIDKRKFDSEQVVTQFLYEGNQTNTSGMNDLQVELLKQNLFYS